MTAIVTVVVLRPFPFAGRKREVNERIQMTPREAAALTAARAVRIETDTDDAEFTRQQTYATRDMLPSRNGDHRYETKRKRKE